MAHPSQNAWSWVGAHNQTYRTAFLKLLSILRSHFQCYRNAQVNPQEGSPDSALISATRHACAEVSPQMNASTHHPFSGLLAAQNCGYSSPSWCRPQFPGKWRPSLEGMQVEPCLVKESSFEEEPSLALSHEPARSTFSGLIIEGLTLPIDYFPVQNWKHAASRGELKMVRMLLDCPEVQADSPDSDNAPALHFAIRQGHFKEVKGQGRQS
eukprot:1161696-Pelagomonas_calceolata.AAC.43